MKLIQSFFLFVCLITLSQYAKADKLGVAIGTPSAINLIYFTSLNQHEIKLSGGYWGDEASGIELSIQALEMDYQYLPNLNVAIGYSQEDDDHTKEWRYVGLTTRFKYSHWYVEPGMSFGDGDYSNPQLLIQLGIIW